MRSLTADAFENPEHRRSVGEGSYVQFIGYILGGHFGGNESVTCDLSTRQNVDIHLALVTVRPSHSI